VTSAVTHFRNLSVPITVTISQLNRICHYLNSACQSNVGGPDDRSGIMKSMLHTGFDAGGSSLHRVHPFINPVMASNSSTADSSPRRIYKIGYWGFRSAS